MLLKSSCCFVGPAAYWLCTGMYYSVCWGCWGMHGMVPFQSHTNPTLGEHKLALPGIIGPKFNPCLLSLNAVLLHASCVEQLSNAEQKSHQK
jgi:hypothetical protein